MEYNTCISTFQFDPEDAGKADKGPSRGAVHRTTLAHSRVLSTESLCGELRMQKVKSHLLRTQSLKVLSGVGKYIAVQATLTARDFFLAYLYPSGPFTCIFPKHLPIFFLCWLWLTPVPV